DGAVWLRTTFTVPKEWIGRELVVDLGKIRDQDFTYINGKLIGTTHDANQGRLYTIPKDLVKAQNQIAIQVINYDDKGGLVGYKDPSRKLSVFPKENTADESVYLTDTWKYWIQNDEAPRVGKYQESYQPFGDLLLDFRAQAPFSNYKRTLDVEQAICKTSYVQNGVSCERTYFSSAPDACLAIHLTADRARQISFDASLASPHKTYNVEKVDDSTIRISVQVKQGVLRGVGFLHVRHEGGELHVGDGKIKILGANQATLFLTAATNYKSYNDVSGD